MNSAKKCENDVKILENTFHEKLFRQKNLLIAQKILCSESSTLKVSLYDN